MEIEEKLIMIRKYIRKFFRAINGTKKEDKVFFNDEIVGKYADVHRELQAVIAIVSNYREGIDIKSSDYRVRAIYKAEGGVSVAGKEIVIKRRDGEIKCYNDWNEKEKTTSLTVKEVIEEILRIQPKKDVKNELLKYAVRNTNAKYSLIRDKVFRFAENPYGGDPLHRLFTYP